MIYGLADLHLDSTGDKSMEVFGSSWKNYQERIFSSWREIVKDDDYVLVPGDISWALKLEDAIVDLKKIESLPGKKVLMRGNHDFWWSSLKKLNELKLKNIYFLANNNIETDDFVFIGTRGWISPNSSEFNEKKDRKIYEREILRLKLSYDSIKDKNKEIICMFHYPPVEKDRTLNEFGKFVLEKEIKIVLYGHLHAMALQNVVDEVVNGVAFHCISADYLKFVPKLIR